MRAQTRPRFKVSHSNECKGIEPGPVLTPREKSPLPEAPMRVEPATLNDEQRGKHTTGRTIPSPSIHMRFVFLSDGLCCPSLLTKVHKPLGTSPPPGSEFQLDPVRPMCVQKQKSVCRLKNNVCYQSLELLKKKKKEEISRGIRGHAPLENC